MLYAEYHITREKYFDAQRAFNELIDEKEMLFARTQPAAISYDKERVSSSGSGRNVFDEYLIAKERSRIDERIAEQKTILDDRKRLKDLKEYELRASKEWHDRIYVYYYLDKLSLTKIESRVPYSRVQIWRILQKIKSNLEKAA